MNPCLKTPTHSRIHHHKGVYWRTVVELDPPAQQLLSRYVFASVWKRALLLFTGMIRQMSLQLSSVPAVGEDLTESTAYVSQIAPIELSALLTGVRGLTAMVIVARRLAVPEVVDYSFSCLLTTLNGKAPNSFPLELTVLSKDLPRMLCAREVFALLPQVAPSLSESWHAFAQLVINLFAMGAFALTPAEESKTSGEPTALSRALPEALHRHPLVRLSSEDGAASSANSSTSESNNSGGSGGGGGGWFSSLLSLANTGKRSRDVEQQQQALMSLRGCVPNIHTFLDITARVPPAAHQLLVRTVCEASTVKFKSPADVRTFSYIFSLLCAMVADRSRTNPAALHTLPIIAASPLAELYTMIEKKLPMDESGLQTALEMSAPGTHTPLDSPVLWLRVLRRVVDGVLSVLAIAMRYRGAADVELLQHLIHLLHAAPKRVYGPIVLTSLLKTVGKLLQEEEEQEESLQRHSTAGEFNPALRALVLTYQRINWERDTSVLDGYETLVCHLAMRERYDPRQQVEELLEVVFAVGMMREKARRRLLASNGHVSSRRSTAGGKQGVNQPADGTASWLLNAFSAQGLVPSAAMALTTCCRSTLRRLLAEMAAANGEAGGGNASDLRLDALRCMGLLSPSSSPPPGPLAASRSVPARREDISVVGYLQHLWLLCLKALGALAMRQSGIPGSGPAPGRPGSEDAMWGLECCVMEALPALRDSLPFLLMLYKELLFPLAETIAVSGSASGAEGEGAAVQHDAPVATSTTLSEAEVIIDRCFYNYWADTLSPPEPTKCRLIRLLPQPILRCSTPITAALATAGLSSSVSAGVDVAVGTQLPSALMVSDQLFNVWKQLLTVLLQFHHTYTQRTTGSPPPEQQVMECVQETVKNMVRAGLTLSTEHVTAAATAAITTTTTTTATTTTTTIPPVSVIPTVEVQSPVEKVESEASAAAQVATADAAVEGDSTTATAAPRSPPPSSLVVGQEAEGASLKPQPQPPRPCAFLVQRREYWTITMEMLRMFSFAAELITEVQQATGIAL